MVGCVCPFRVASCATPGTLTCLRFVLGKPDVQGVVANVFALPAMMRFSCGTNPIGRGSPAATTLNEATAQLVCTNNNFVSTVTPTEPVSTPSLRFDLFDNNQP